ncbi:S16 family serine protease [Nitrospira sp. KM1]|uniref:S16 family serine protease n=1 Tax=Nitrospira sp. KM1 TaxID=1936990 RepID=UPI0015642677
MSPAQGKRVHAGSVLTGTVYSDGRIGRVGRINLKIQAAKRAQLHRVLVPHHQAPLGVDFSLSPTFVVSPVRSIPDALMPD